MHAAPRLELPYRVRFDEAGQDGRLRASGFLRFAQDLAAAFGSRRFRPASAERPVATAIIAP